MSISYSLKAAARSAYRSLYRSSALTFEGDEPVLRAFRMKMRSEYIQCRNETDPQLYKERVNHAEEVAEVLRRNFVQARRDAGDGSVWHVRMTEHTELGSNDTVKSPEPLSSSRSARKLGEIEGSAIPDDDKPPRPLYYSQLKKVHRKRIVPELCEGDLEESFVRGSGPGGQSINKTQNNVQLLHKPTGIRVTCQETRSLEQNRRIARRKLIQKLDELSNPGLSKADMQRAKQIERERRRRKKAKKQSKETGSEMT